MTTRARRLDDEQKLEWRRVNKRGTQEEEPEPEMKFSFAPSARQPDQLEAI